MAHDPSGRTDETIKLLPDPELMKFCRGIKTADRELRIEGNNALVTTFRKSTTSNGRRSSTEVLVTFRLWQVRYLPA